MLTTETYFNTLFVTKKCITSVLKIFFLKSLSMTYIYLEFCTDLAQQIYKCLNCMSVVLVVSTMVCSAA